MRNVVGIDRKIKRSWLDAVLDRLAQTNEVADLRSFLDDQLKAELPGKESRAKSTGIVLRIWSGIPPERIALRDRAVALLPRISGQERIWLHWGMTALAYPFFRDTAEVVGRLLALQDDFTTAQVQGRMLTTWGDRATSKEAAQKLITTLVDWDVLRSTSTKGHFLLARKMRASTPELQLWLLEALLAASTSDEIEAQQLLRLPESFPFAISVGIADLRRHEGFNIHRQGLNMDMIAVRRVKAEPPSKPARKTKAPKRDHGSIFDTHAERVGLDLGVTDAVSATPVTPPPKEEQLVGPFAAPSQECAEQFRDGHYFGCIALAQALLEAMIRHVWQTKVQTPIEHEGGFDKIVEYLHKRKFITDEWKTKLDRMWAERQLFQHLRCSVECDRKKLEETARDTLTLLKCVEREFFGFSVQRL